MRTKTALVLGPLAGSAACFTGWAIAWLRYSPWGDTGVLTAGTWLGVTGLLLLILPAGAAVIGIARSAHRELRALGLSAGQARTVELGALAVADAAWYEYNRKVSERLTESVMGPEREDYNQWPGN
jgi:hypothetical protein